MVSTRGQLHNSDAPSSNVRNPSRRAPTSQSRARQHNTGQQRTSSPVVETDNPGASVGTIEDPAGPVNTDDEDDSSLKAIKFTARLAEFLVSATLRAKPWDAPHGEVTGRWKEVASTVTEEAKLSQPLRHDTAQTKMRALRKYHEVCLFMLSTFRI